MVMEMEMGTGMKYMFGNNAINTSFSGDGESALWKDFAGTILRAVFHCHNYSSTATHKIHGASHSFHHFALFRSNRWRWR